MEESNYQVRGNWGHGSLGPKFSEFKETKRNKNSLEKKMHLPKTKVKRYYPEHWSGGG